MRPRVVAHGCDWVREDDVEKGAEEAEPREVPRELQAAPSEQRGLLQLFKLRRWALVSWDGASLVGVELVQERSLAVAGRAKTHSCARDRGLGGRRAGASERREMERAPAVDCGRAGCGTDGARVRRRAGRDDRDGRGQVDGHACGRRFGKRQRGRLSDAGFYPHESVPVFRSHLRLAK